MVAAARRSRSQLTALLAALALAAGCGGGSGSPGPAAPPFPSGAGIKQGLSLAALQAAGWRLCWNGAYDETGLSLATLLDGCAGDHLMLACRADGSTDTLTLGAADAFSVVTEVTVEGIDTFHTANGVSWYYTDIQSWGFFPAGETVDRESCDVATTAADKRLCWHAEAQRLTDGFRCGATINLNAGLAGAGTWERLLLVH